MNAGCQAYMTVFNQDPHLNIQKAAPLKFCRVMGKDVVCASGIVVPGSHSGCRIVVTHSNPLAAALCTFGANNLYIHVIP